MTDKIEVSIDFGDGPQRLGALVREKRKVFFGYDKEYLERGYNISPVHLRWSPDVQRAPTSLFDGLFGVFGDSLPDGWGRLLLDRELRRQGVDLGDINSLDRLAYVGEGGKGALTYRPVLSAVNSDLNPLIILDELAKSASLVLKAQLKEGVPDLLRLGGSSGGARPKIQVLYNPVTGDLLPDSLPVPNGYEAWIIKFSASEDPADTAITEFVYSLAARKAGIEMSNCRLFTTPSGNRYFGTRRFDRGIGMTRRHLHSFAGLVNDNFRLPNVDYGHLMDAAFRLERDVTVYQNVLRLAAFNVFAHNRDDHSNNFSFLMDKSGQWSLAPAYDLTFSQPAHGEHSLTVSGEGRQPGWDHLRQLAKHFDVQNSEAILQQVWEVIIGLPGQLLDSGVDAALARNLDDHTKRLDRSY